MTDKWRRCCNPQLRAACCWPDLCGATETFDDQIDWYALSNGLPTVMPDGTLVHGED